MNKNANNKTKNQEQTPSRQLTLRLATVVRRNLYAFVIREGIKALDEMLEQDRERLCGPANGKGERGDPLRWGRTEGRLVMGGQRVLVRKPRVRRQGHEVTLPSWEQFADEDPLDERTFEQLVLGVSTRDYGRSVETLPAELGPHGASKSAANRRFVDTTRRKLQDWQRRDLSKIGSTVIMLDSLCIQEHSVIVALGIDETGQKQPLGLWLGATENSQACGALLDNLIERGLDPQRAYLFVIDGSKALRKAIRERFSDRVLVQRCQVHKLRNVLGHLPKKMHPSVSKTICDAYRGGSKATAKKRLLQLAAGLQEDYPDASASLKEGLDETLTLKDMGLPANLERALSTTNPIENLNSTIRRVTRNVKRWRDGNMVKRWIAASVLEAQRGFRRLRGFKGMPILIRALLDYAEQINCIDAQQEAA